MKLIVGLGNPGAEYKNNRHNIGFMLVDKLAHRWGIDMARKKFQARYGGGMCGFENVVLLKPQTFMNRSGGSVLEAMVFYKTDLDDLLVIYDDLAIELGTIRSRSKGSAGGHNGIKDIINRFSTDDFSRLRIGIGGPKFGNTVKHVLGNFEEDEVPMLNRVLDKSVDAVEYWVANGIKATMNEYNGSIEP